VLRSASALEENRPQVFIIVPSTARAASTKHPWFRRLPSDGAGFRRRVWIGGAVLSACLSACSSAPQLTRPDLGPRSERTVYAALDKVQSSDDERLRILQAYDASTDHLRDLAKQSRDLLREWDQLDRTAPDFTTKVEALATRWAALNDDEMRTRGRFEHSVATILTAKQWQTWQTFMRAPRSREEEGEEFERRRHSQ
jgi:hypothetical protein